MSVTYPTLPAPFITDVQHTAIAIAYKNPAFIAESVVPTVTVDAPTFTWNQFNQKDRFTLPAEGIEVSRRGLVPEVDFSAVEQSAVTKDYALDGAVPRRDQMAKPSMNALNRTTEQTAELRDLAREKRTSDMVFNTASYASGNSTTLSGTSQWSDKTNSDPILAMLTVMDSMLVRPNQLVLGHLVATQLRTHPKIVQAFNGTTGQYGQVPLAFIQELLEIDEIVVGRSVYNAANKGQSTNLTRLWGKHAALLYKNPITASTEDFTFAVSAQWGRGLAGRYFDEKKGAYGSDIVRVVESRKELVLANDCGYFFQNAIA
ncbi:hypothetical protein [Terriglobus albidus]|uniref:hypothetical protein n=1 Tax=Terriglobus albidus TaxID=1592106 RepID=UPI0021E09971|nr:hypothetical protein [Terriglobus albidus]